MSQLFRETPKHNDTQASFPTLLRTRMPRTRHCRQFIIFRHFSRFNDCNDSNEDTYTKDRTYVYGAEHRNKIKNANLLRSAVYIFVHLKISYCLKIIMIKSDHRTFMYV